MSEASASGYDDLTEGKLLSITAVQGVGLTGFGLSLWIFSGRETLDWLSFTPYDLQVGLICTAALIGLAIVGYFFPRLSLYLIRMQAQSYGWLTKFASWRVILIISFFAGLWEEALFRGGLQVLLTDYVGAPLAIIIASVIFAAIHLSKPIIGCIQFLIGCFFGVVYWQTGSLVGVMLAHFLYDVFALWYLIREMNKLQAEGLLELPE